MRRMIWALLLFCALLPTQGCSLIRLGWVDENSHKVEYDDKKEQPPVAKKKEDSILPPDMGPLGGHFDKDGKWIPDDPEIEATYKIPDIGAGFLFDAKTFDVSPAIQVELLEFDTRIPYVRRIKLDAGVGYNRTYLYVGKLWTSIFEVSTGGFVGWNWDDQELSYGAAFTIIKF